MDLYNELSPKVHLDCQSFPRNFQRHYLLWLPWVTGHHMRLFLFAVVLLTEAKASATTALVTGDFATTLRRCK
jgi:hypothetical protein